MSNSKRKVQCVKANSCKVGCRHAHPHGRVSITNPTCHCTEWSECVTHAHGDIKVRCVGVVKKLPKIDPETREYRRLERGARGIFK